MQNNQMSFGTGRGVVLIGKSTSVKELTRVSVLADAVTALGAGTNAAKMVEAAMNQRPRTLYYKGLGNGVLAAGAYKDALIKAAEAPGAYFYVVDDNSAQTITDVKDFLTWCDTNAIRAVVLIGGSASVVTTTNHYRIWITDDNFADNTGAAVPAFVGAAATAAALSNESDLSMPFGGVRINGYTIKTVKHVDTLRTQTEAGLMSFMQVGTQIEIFQGTTSYTNPATGEEGLKDPEVVCTVDEVILSVEQRVYNKHNRTKISRLPDIKDTIYSALDLKRAEEKIYPPDPDRIIAQPDPEVRGKGKISYHFNVIPGLKELEINVTGEVTAQNV